MKTKSLLLILMLFAHSAIAEIEDINQYLENSKKLGLISYLTTVKSLAEFKATNLASKKSLDDASKAQYNILKLSVDRLVNQLSADMITANTSKSYKKINRHINYKKKDLSKKYNQYDSLIIHIDNIAHTFLRGEKNAKLAEVGLDQITGVVELIRSGITDARDFREKKVQSLIAIMDKLRLDKLKDLTEPKKEDEES